MPTPSVGGGLMRSVSSAVRRSTAVLAVVVLLLIPVAGVADDAEIRPPHPQSVVQPAQPSVWHVLLVILANSRLVPLVG
jgi:hypothetical protein